MRGKLLTARAKLLTALAVLFSALLLVGIIGLQDLGRTQSDMKNLYRAQMLPAQWIAEINTIVQDELLTLDNALIGGDVEHVDALRREFQASAVRSERLWSEFRAVPESGEARELADSFWSARASYLQSLAHALDLLDKGQTLVAGSWRNSALQRAYAAQRQPLQKLLDLQDQLAEQAYRAAAFRYERAKWLAISAILTAVGVGALLGWMLLRSMLTALSHAVATSERIAAGQLGHASAATSEDEFGRLTGALRAMDDRLSAIVGGVRDGAVEVAEAARRIAASNGQLATRTRAQSSTLTAAAASISAASDAMKSNASNANVANRLGHAAREQANRGGEVVREAIIAMHEINSASRKISDIINVIDEIAFQTNLLALNAAVEAARAGEHGRGFAVVAAEVRNLAQRSAGAAREIKALIHDSVAKIEGGTRSVNTSGQVLDQIVASVKEVTEIITLIAEASHEQATDMHRLNQVMSEMQGMTVENSALVEDAENTGRAMEARSAQFMEQVRYFAVAKVQERTSMRSADDDAASWPGSSASALPVIAKWQAVGRERPSRSLQPPAVRHLR